MTAAWRNCRCDCPEKTCTGTVCVDLAAPCSSSHDDNYLVTVKDRETGDVIGTATTNSAGVACVAIPESSSDDWPKSVDVTATKSNCRTLTWSAVSVPCGGTVNLTGDAKCGVGYIQYQFFGCYNTAIRNLPVTLTNASTGYSETVSTNNSGQARFYPPSGPGYVVTTSPEGFNPFTSPTWTVGDCAQISQSVTLTVASTHACCEAQKLVTPTSPYPIKKTLTLTDSQGSFPITLAGCAGTACVTRTDADVGDCPAPIVDCSGTSSVVLPTIATGSVAVRFDLSLSPGGFAGVGLAQWWRGIADGLARYRTPDAPCPPASQVHRLWRCSGTTCASEFNQRVDPVNVTIHSMHPLLITVDFPATRVMGPIPAGTLPNPLSAGSIVTSVVISE